MPLLSKGLWVVKVNTIKVCIFSTKSEREIEGWFWRQGRNVKWWFNALSCPAATSIEVQVPTSQQVDGLFFLSLSLFRFLTTKTIHVLSFSSPPSLLHPARVEKVTVLSTTLQGLLIFSMPVVALDYWALPGRTLTQMHTPCPSLDDPAKPQHFSVDKHNSLYLY